MNVAEKPTEQPLETPPQAPPEAPDQEPTPTQLSVPNEVADRQSTDWSAMDYRHCPSAS